MASTRLTKTTNPKCYEVCVSNYLVASMALDLTLRHLEASGSAWISEDESQALGQALETFGVIVIFEGDGMGAGVRLKFTRQDARQIGRLETEGGITRSDDVP